MEIENFNPQKILPSSPSLEIRSTPSPPPPPPTSKGQSLAVLRAELMKHPYCCALEMAFNNPDGALTKMEEINTPFDDHHTIIRQLDTVF